MKKNLKKLILIGATLLLGACLGNEKENKENVVIETKKPTQIEYWHVASETFGGGTIKDLVKEFNEMNPDIQVIERFNPDMYKGLTQNLQIALASKKVPDIVQMGYSYLNYANDNFEYSTAQEIINKYFPEDKDYLERHFLKNVLELGQVNNSQVGIPYSISNPILYYNADLFKEAGLNPDTPPITWKEVIDAAKKIKDKTGNPGFFMQEYADNWAQQALIESNGGQMLKIENGKSIPTFSSKESAEAYQLLADMVKNKIAIHASNDEGFQSFLNGKLGMVITTIGKRQNFESSSSFDLRGTQFPVFDAKSRKVPAGGNMLMILSKDSEKQQASWRFIKFLLENKSAVKWTKGTGYLPSQIVENGTELDEFLNENKLMKVALSQMPNMKQWASFSGSNGLKAEQILIDTRDIILSGEKPADKALEDAQDQIIKLMN